jgi:hypothetical protein
MRGGDARHSEETAMQADGSFVRRVMWILWPAFLAAGVAEAVFFTLFDPFDLHFFGAPLDLSRELMYTLGFFGFWLLAITSSALTMFLEGSLTSSGERKRPAGCPMAADAQCAAVCERATPEDPATAGR